MGSIGVEMCLGFYGLRPLSSNDDVTGVSILDATISGGVLLPLHLLDQTHLTMLSRDLPSKDKTTGVSIFDATTTEGVLLRLHLLDLTRLAILS